MVSLNFPDLLICQGLYQQKAPLPAVPGCEAVGAQSKFKLGERVIGFNHGGGTLADYFVIDNTIGWTVPDTQAAALSVT